jgi:hypothetical protein
MSLVSVGIKCMDLLHKDVDPVKSRIKSFHVYLLKLFSYFKFRADAFPSGIICMVDL